MVCCRYSADGHPEEQFVVQDMSAITLDAKAAGACAHEYSFLATSGYQEVAGDRVVILPERGYPMSSDSTRYTYTMVTNSLNSPMTIHVHPGVRQITSKLGQFRETGEQSNTRF